MIPSPLEAVHHDGRYPVLRLKRGEDRRLTAGHLWIFSNEVDTDASPLSGFGNGELVQVQSDRGHFLGHAYLNPHALICARLLTREPRPIDEALIVERLQVALTLRERISAVPYRWVFSRATGCPGSCSIATATSSSGRSPRPEWKRCAPPSSRPFARCSSLGHFTGRTTSAARTLEQLSEHGRGRVRRGAREHRGDRGRRALQRTAAARSEDGLVLRSKLEPRAPAGAAAARCAGPDVCSYVGAWAIRALR